MKIDVNFNFEYTKAYLKKFNAAMSESNRRKVHQEAAEIWKKRMVRRTPKRWTGQTAKSWVIRRGSGTLVELVNNTKAMRYLEHGTPPHGPKTAKRLFVPLTKRAAMAGPRGVMAANQSAKAQSQWSGYGAAAAGKKAKKKKLPFVVGKDFVFAKSVRGIRAMHLARGAQGFVGATIKLLAIRHLVEKLR